MDSEILLPQPSVPAGGAVLNPFVIVDDAAGLVDFVSGVFGVAENAEVSVWPRFVFADEAHWLVR